MLLLKSLRKISYCFGDLLDLTIEKPLPRMTYLLHNLPQNSNKFKQAPTSLLLSHSLPVQVTKVWTGAVEE